MHEELPPLDGSVVLCFDVDSTTANHETMTSFVEKVCEDCDEPLRSEAFAMVQDATEKGMRGELDFTASLEERMKIIRRIGATRRHVQAYNEIMLDDPRKALTPSFAENAAWIANNQQNILFLSGGMDDMVVPLLRQGLGIEDEARISTNAFVYDGDGLDARIIGYDRTRALYHGDGKRRQIHAYRQAGVIPELAVMVGDGANDRNAKSNSDSLLHGADSFIAFTEIADRGLNFGVDYTAENLPQAIHFAGSLALKLDAAR